MTLLGFRRTRFARCLVIVLASLLIRSTVVRANDVIPPAPAPVRTPIVGFIDTHLHQFANLGFGGLEVFGSPMDPSLDPNAPLSDARARALPDSDFIYVPAAEASDYLGIGGAAVGGPVVSCPTGPGDCVKITVHGPGGSNDLLNQLIPNGSPSHGTMGYPDMNGWPAFDVLTTQQAYWEWLARAHKHGLKMIVMLAVNNSVLCQLALHRASYGCGDDAAVNRQIQGAKDLETYIDARAAAEGKEGFYKIVYSSEEARTAIQAGKLAVVLGTEVDTAWGCEAGTASCDDPFIEARVQDYYDAGIRVVYPVHLMDNRFGGTAVYNGLFELANKIETGSYFDIVACGSPIEWRSDIRDTISDLKVAVDALIITAIATLGAALPALDLAMQGFMAAFPLMGLMSPLLAGIGIGASLIPFSGIVFFAIAAAFIIDAPGAVGEEHEGNCNNRGLTAAGHTLINALMDRKMIIDVDHTSRKMFDEVLDIAEARGYPGIVTGHTGLLGATLTRSDITGMGHTFHASDSGRHEGNKSGAQLERILDLGGFVSLGMNGGGRLQTKEFSSSDGVAFDCGRSSQAFAQQYLFATQTLGITAIGIGSDINGFAGSVAPRYGSKACKGDFPGGYDSSTLAGRINYPTTDYFGAPLGKYTFGNQTWDFNTDGFAHAGLFPDFIADLRAINLSNADLAPLFNGVEGYVRMWEKIDDDAAPTWRCGTVGEDWHANDVTVPCLSYDFGYGLANAADANFSLSTNLPEGMETGNASTGTHPSICDAAPSAHCTGVIPAISGINVDKKDPTVTVTTPAAGTPAYLLNETITANYGCVDGGSGVDECDGPVASGAAVDTTAVGTHAFTVTGSDNVGHVVNVAHPYNVTFKICVSYDQTKAHQAGSTVPIKLTVCDVNDVNVSSSAIVLTATGTTLLSTSAPGPLEDAGNANPDDQFRFVNNSYIFNLKTSGMTTGTYALTFTATGDPIPHQVQFQVR